MSEYLIENIDTQKGEEVISALRKNKWKLIAQYSLFAFDKGIDFDFYRMEKNDEELYFEWNNWFEWKIIGSQHILNMLVIDYSLKEEIQPNYETPDDHNKPLE